MSVPSLKPARSIGKRNFVEEHGTGPAAASLVKKLRRVWTQRAHNVIRAMATKRERTT